MDIEAIALPTPKEFISLHGWMLSQLNLSKIVSPHLSAEQNCKSVLKYIDNFPWAADAKESVEEYIEMPVTTCLSPTNSSSSSSDLQPAASEADAQVLKTPSGFDKRRLKLYKNSEFACEPCGRNFGTKSSYTQHCKAYHSGPMEHRCGQCGKRFNTEAKMKMHERLHTMKDKPFKCQQCSSQFIYSHDLKRHEMKRHGQGNGFVCKICGLKCSRPDILALHEIRHTRKTGK
ncbi:oocyte zinc finger protein XlCOF14-like [Armigeres subalbatus]|uniref:oocyte zinc finger protein XlCOF14-like n=1 Tax=Armigeres subalbatus TaxID=124917 RepID=UPI002ED24F87